MNFIIHNFDFTFIIIVFLIHFTCEKNYILSNDIPIIEPQHLEKLYEICKNENYLFCSITEAIKHSLFISRIDYKSFPEKNEEIINLRYENVYTPNLICENLEAKIEEEKILISLLNCTVIASGALILRNNTEIIYHYKSFFSELYFKKLNFYQNKRSTKGELNVTFDYNEDFSDSYNFDKTDPIFDLSPNNLLIKMNEILKQVLKNYIYNLKSKIEIDENLQISQIKYLSEINSKFAKGYNLFNFEIDENKNNITYIGYNDIQYKDFINIKNKIFIPYLFVSFEYALNFNITYNEGNFTFENVTISRNTEEDYFGSLINKNADFNSMEESNIIWNIINSNFYINFKEYK